jgi:hypothetical protein
MYERYGMIKEIRELLNGCEWKKLGEVCEFGKKSKRPASFGKSEGKYKFYTSSYNIKKCDVIDYKGEYIIIGDGGNPVINIDNKFSCSDHNILISINNANTSNIYIYNHIKFSIPLGILKMKGSSIKNISKDTITKIPIPVPSLPIQQKCIEVYQQKETVLKDYDKKIEDYENDIKHNQELGRQVIEYYITADVQPDIKESDTEIINELSDSNDTDMKTISSNKSKSQKKKKQKEHSIESYDDEPEIRVVSKKRKKKVIRREL